MVYITYNLQTDRQTDRQTEHRLTAPFLRLARRLKLNTTFVMDDRRILTGIRHKGYREAVDSL